MLHIDAVMQDPSCVKAFASIDFTSGYWQLPMHEESQPRHAFMTPHYVMKTTRTSQGDCNSTGNFQASVEPCFSELRDHLLAWPDNLVLYHSTESSLLKVIDRFLQICADHLIVVQCPSPPSLRPKSSSVEDY